MLFLNRKIGESVVIGEDIYCTVLGIRDSVVKLGFDAPETMPINRDEIHRRIQQERLEGGEIDEHTIEIDEAIVDRLIAKFKNQTRELTTH